MVDGDVQLAQAVTPTRIAVTKDDGIVVIKQVLESLDTPPQKLTAKPKRPEFYSNIDQLNFEPMDYNSPPQTGQSKRSWVSIFLPR